MSACKSGIGTVFGRCECECGGSIRPIGRIVDHNSPLGTRTVVRGQEFCSVDLGIFAVSQAPISMVANLVDRLAIGFHGLCSSTDCIRPIGRCNRWAACHRAIVAVIGIVVAVERFAVAFVAIGCHWSSSSNRIALASGSNRPMTTAMEPPTIVVYYNRPANRATDTSWALVGIDSCRWFDAYQGTSMLEWLHHSCLVA